jgi:excinuclease UvrABC ATPase subunit
MRPADGVQFRLRYEHTSEARMNEFIQIRGARENNLKDVSLRIPKRKITIFTGVSGSGKSSIVFDTIATEAQRQLYENFSLFIRNFLPRYPPPEADAIENLSMAVIVDQKRLGGGSHSTVGTVTDIYTLLRLLFSRIGQPNVGYSNAFSFNDPQGMCPECGGLGKKVGVVSDDFIDLTKSLKEGAVKVPFFAPWEHFAYTASGFFDIHKKLKHFTKEEMDLLLHGKGRKFKMKFGDSSINVTYLGIIAKVERSYIRRDIKLLSERTRKAVEPYLRPRQCPLCKGARLSQAALGSKIRGRNIAELSAMEIGELVPFLRKVTGAVAAPILTTLVERLEHVVDIGLEYLSLNRETDTLSGGESQRIRMVKHLGSSLVDVMYIFDEPSVGLHPRDVHRLNELLQKLRDKGNTVIVVEHDPDVIKIADHVVDVGPHAGTAGGRIVFEGRYEDLLGADTVTAKHLQQALPLKDEPRRASGKLPIKNARDNNLQNISVDVPTAVLTVITGVAGSGKSSLINEAFLRQHPDAVVIDQSAVGASTRSNPATYTGVMDDVRKAFAAANKVNAGLFSFNSKGACEKCNGSGVIYSDLAFLDAVRTPCEVCRGRRFKDDVLAYTVQGQVDQRRPGADRGRSPRLLHRETDRPHADRDARRRPRLPDARPAAQHALRRRVPADQTGERAPQAGKRLRPRRTDDRAAPIGRQPPARHPRSARGRRQHGRRDRAQHGRDPKRRLDHRSRPGGRQQRRTRGLCGAAEGLARCEAVVDAPVSSAGRHGDLNVRPTLVTPCGVP